MRIIDNLRRHKRLTRLLTFWGRHGSLIFSLSDPVSPGKKMCQFTTLPPPSGPTRMLPRLFCSAPQPSVGGTLLAGYSCMLLVSSLTDGALAGAAGSPPLPPPSWVLTLPSFWTPPFFSFLSLQIPTTHRPALYIMVSEPSILLFLDQPFQPHYLFSALMQQATAF